MFKRAMAGISRWIVKGLLGVVGWLIGVRNGLAPEEEIIITVDEDKGDDSWTLCREKVMKTIHLYNPTPEQLETLAGYMVGKAKMKRLIASVVEKEEWEKIRGELESGYDKG